MRFYRIGRSPDGQVVSIPESAFATHLHLVGASGSGKTTAAKTILKQLALHPSQDFCIVIVDILGGLSQDLLVWMASEEFCTDEVRERLILLRPSEENYVLPFNTLLYESDGHGYFKVERTTEIVLRAWESVDLSAMPRLARWTFNAFWAAAQLGLTIADCAHFLMPGSRYHAPLLACLPDRLKAEWTEIMTARGGEAIRTLDSSRNRLKPYFESDILRRMFGASENRFDVARFMREGKIVLVDLSSRNRLGTQLARTIGGLIVNEVLATARNLSPLDRRPTFLLLDEFQNFVGPDMDAALPEVRQLGIRLMLAHQSFAQLKRGAYDLSAMIWQAQSRMIFGMQGEDADLLAHEVASLTFDPRRIKEELYSRRQLVAGQRIVELSSWSESQARSEQWSRTYGENWSAGQNISHNLHREVRSDSAGRGGSEGSGEGHGESSTRTTGAHQTLTPVYDEFLELANRTYTSFEEQRNEWARDIRKAATGEALLRLVNDPTLYRIKVERSAPGYLRHDLATLSREFPEVIDAYHALVEKNFKSSGLFLPAHVVDQQAEERLQAVINPKIKITSTPVTPGRPVDVGVDEDRPSQPPTDSEPFA